MNWEYGVELPTDLVIVFFDEKSENALLQLYKNATRYLDLVRKLDRQSLISNSLPLSLGRDPRVPQMASSKKWDNC